MVVCDLDGAAARVVAEAIRSAGGRAEALAADVTAADAPARMVNAAISAFGGIDILYEDVEEGIMACILPIHFVTIHPKISPLHAPLPQNQQRGVHMGRCDPEDHTRSMAGDARRPLHRTVPSLPGGRASHQGGGQEGKFPSSSPLASKSSAQSDANADAYMSRMKAPK